MSNVIARHFFFLGVHLVGYYLIYYLFLKYEHHSSIFQFIAFNQKEKEKKIITSNYSTISQNGWVGFHQHLGKIYLSIYLTLMMMYIVQWWTHKLSQSSMLMMMMRMMMRDISLNVFFSSVFGLNEMWLCWFVRHLTYMCADVDVSPYHLSIWNVCMFIWWPKKKAMMSQHYHGDKLPADVWRIWSLVITHHHRGGLPYPFSLVFILFLFVTDACRW